MALASSYNYRDIILENIRKNKGVRGYQSQLAKAASCHSSYFTHLLRGDAQLTPDQAAALSDFWDLNKRDSEYFITLVNLERASTPSLQKKLRDRLQELRQISDKLPAVEISDLKMSYEHALRYFSNWYVSAIHRALDIPELGHAQAISSRLSLPIDLVEKTLEFLKDMNLAHKDGKKWKSSDDGFNLNRSKELMGIYHAAMRNRAVISYDHPSASNVHFSAIVTISKSDCKAFQDALKKFISEAMNGFVESPSEELMGMTFDFFTV